MNGVVGIFSVLSDQLSQGVDQIVFSSVHPAGSRPVSRGERDRRVSMRLHRGGEANAAEHARGEPSRMSGVHTRGSFATGNASGVRRIGGSRDKGLANDDFVPRTSTRQMQRAAK